MGCHLPVGHLELGLHILQEFYVRQKEKDLVPMTLKECPAF